MQYHLITTVPATVSALEVPSSAPILADSQARPRAERLATVGAENFVHLVILIFNILSQLQDEHINNRYQIIDICLKYE